MKPTQWIGGLALALALVSCNDSDAGTSGTNPDAAGPGQPAPAEAAKTKNPEDAKVRSKLRWQMIAAQDWIQVYDFLTPSRKKQENLGMFLSGKNDHEYENPTEPALIGTEGDEAYIEVSAMWTPQHKEILAVDNLPPGGWTEQLDMIETWTWIDGEWFWTETDRQNDFFKEHPNIGR